MIWALLQNPPWAKKKKRKKKEESKKEEKKRKDKNKKEDESYVFLVLGEIIFVFFDDYGYYLSIFIVYMMELMRIGVGVCIMIVGGDV